MKKIGLLVLGCCLLWGSTPIYSKNEELKFVILFDSKETSLNGKKQEIVDLVNETLEYLDEMSYEDYLSASYLELENKGRQVRYLNHTLYFYLGDYQGIRVNGNLVRNRFCMVEVKPKSFILKWLGF